METRLNLQTTDPDGYNVMLIFEKYLAYIDITKIQKELIKIRASQINGCSYCINMHTKDARKNGETEQRIYALNAWRDTPFFNEEEKAILALTEEITLITGRVSDNTYNEAIKILGEKKVGQIIMAIIAINAWNRIGIATNMQPTVY